MTFHSGFVSLVGRPNVGKSTLVNCIVGAKVAIVSARPQTTRTQIRGVRTTPASQIVLLDTPGIHKPRTMLGERTNERARSTLSEVDVVCMLVDATAKIGSGDRFVADLVQAVATPKILVVSKTDIAAHRDIAEHLAAASEALGEFDAYVPLSGLTGTGVDALVGEIESRLPEGPMYYPGGEVTDQPETFLAAELLREKLLLVARDELPHSIAVIVEEIEPEGGEDGKPDSGGPNSGGPNSGGPNSGGPNSGGRADDDGIVRLRALILVERESQKGIVIGKGGSVLKEAGTRAREELEALLGARVYLETKVKVERDWQRRAHSLDRLGF
ncbi:MAG: GTPase Era [Acidimicrobiia bacterium]